MEKINEQNILEFLYQLLFKDNNGNPYSNECSQNALVRKQADKWGLDLKQYEDANKNR